MNRLHFPGLFLVLALGLAACQEPNAPPRTPPKTATQEVAPPAAAPVVTGGAKDAGPDVDLSASTEASFCNIESVGQLAFSGGSVKMKAGDPIRGWAGHSEAVPVESLFLLFVDPHRAVRVATPLSLSVRRDDVADAHGGREDLRNAGFESAAPALPAGQYSLMLHYVVDAKPYRCDNGRQVVVD